MDNMEALTLGKPQTMAGVANLILRMMESPITSVRCLTLSAEVEEACRPTDQPTRLVREENQFADDYKAGHRTSYWPL